MKTVGSTSLARVPHVAAAAALVCGLLAGCPGPIKSAKTPLTEYVQSNNFEVFDPPRSADGLGTIIQFKNAQESVVFRRDRCLPPDKIPSLPPEDRRIGALEGAYEIATDAKLELTLSRALMQSAFSVPVDIGAAFGASGVKKVKISFVEPYRDAIERGAAKDLVRALPKQNSCREEFLRPGNFVIHTVLGAKGIKYEFIGTDDKGVAITAEILDKIKASPELRAKWSGALGISVDGDILIGYRAWVASEVPGALEQQIEVSEAPPELIAERKQ